MVRSIALQDFGDAFAYGHTGAAGAGGQVAAVVGVVLAMWYTFAAARVRRGRCRGDNAGASMSLWARRSVCVLVRRQLGGSGPRREGNSVATGALRSDRPQGIVYSRLYDDDQVIRRIVETIRMPKHIN